MTNIKYNYPPPGTAELQPGYSASACAFGGRGGAVCRLRRAGIRTTTAQINTLPLTDPNNTANPYDLRQGVANWNAEREPVSNLPGLSAHQPGGERDQFQLQLPPGGHSRMENRHGLTTQVAYTWSHEIASKSERPEWLSNPFNAKYDRGSEQVRPAPYSQRELRLHPAVFRERLESGCARMILGGWSVSGNNGLAIRDILSTIQLYRLRHSRPGRRQLPTVRTWFQGSPTRRRSSHGSAPVLSLIRSLPGPAGQIKASAAPEKMRWWDLDSSTGTCHCSRRFLYVREGPRIELRFESFNTFNHTQFQGVDPKQPRWEFRTSHERL